MTTTNANCYKPPFPPCEGGLSQITTVTNPNGSITYTHTDWEWGPAVSWTVWGAGSVLSANNDLWIDTLWNIQTGYPLVRDTYTNSAGFIREFNNNVHFNIGNANNNTGNNALVVGNSTTNSGNFVSLSGRQHTNTGESSNITGAINNNTASFSSMYGRQNFNTAESSQVWGAGNENNWPFSNIIGSWNTNELTSNFVWGFWNDVNGDAWLTVGQNVVVNTWWEYKWVTYGKDIVVTGALSSVGWLGNTMNGGWRNVVGWEFNTLTDVNYSWIFWASSTATGWGHIVWGIGHTVDWNNNFTNGSNNDTNGFNSVAMLWVDLTAVRSEQTHINYLYVNPAYRVFSSVSAGIWATLPWEVFFVSVAGWAQQMYRHA